ncbi:hypothetical protein E3N88_23327 [Mikania micrantha]|uniref:J domain-containing protein n=1 Tax=Mikania micrantha TaxID=192012 RepID=A0A5N6NCZ4_9ASTR|nr:hypothetical protein E3N88_23327 [Mikania micrantha]
MVLSTNSIHQTHYNILNVKEDASHGEIRKSYKSALLNSHPDKLQKTSQTTDVESRFLEIQTAWEILGDVKLRALYDIQLRAARQDEAAADEIKLEDLVVEAGGDMVELFYQCRCGDYFSLDSLELGEMGLQLLIEGDNIMLQARDCDDMASILLSCVMSAKTNRKMGSWDGIPHWSVYDRITIIPSKPEALMAEINSAISSLECAKASKFQNTSSTLSKSKKSVDDGSLNSCCLYDARRADEAYKAGLAYLAAGNLEEAFRSLNVALTKCPPSKTSAVAKLRSLISLTAQRLRKSAV